MVIAGTVVDEGRIVWGPDGEPGAGPRKAPLRRLLLRHLARAATECPGAELTTKQLHGYLNGRGREEILRALTALAAEGIATRRVARESISRADTRPITRDYWRLAPRVASDK